ncbi:MAG: hypothetical protein KDC87_19480, partial [Planctomycetes bacterium]|nr:hypothetical protein [Planctomycetota bacterium]
MVAVRHGGELVLDVSGTRVVARAGGVLLAPGTVQRFLVVANDPVLLLRPNGAALPWDALPGVGPVRLANLLRSLDADTPGCGFPADRTAGESTAALRAWHLGLGHDLEARAVRLAIACRGAPPPAGTVAALRHTVKARALAVLANPGSRANAAAELVRLLNAI